jgi:hypothetical protein
MASAELTSVPSAHGKHDAKVGLCNEFCGHIISLYPALDPVPDRPSKVRHGEDSGENKGVTESVVLIHGSPSTAVCRMVCLQGIF